jgi:hypothetical protein
MCHHSSAGVSRLGDAPRGVSTVGKLPFRDTLLERSVRREDPLPRRQEGIRIEGLLGRSPMDTRQSRFIGVRKLCPEDTAGGPPSQIRRARSAPRGESPPPKDGPHRSGASHPRWIWPLSPRGMRLSPRGASLRSRKAGSTDPGRVTRPARRMAHPARRKAPDPGWTEHPPSALDGAGPNDPPDPSVYQYASRCLLRDPPQEADAAL